MCTRRRETRRPPLYSSFLVGTAHDVEGVEIAASGVPNGPLGRLQQGEEVRIPNRGVVFRCAT